MKDKQEEFWTKQIKGAFGERAVEAELLRGGWLAGNVNASGKNAKDFDVFAIRGKDTIDIQVKTTGQYVAPTPGGKLDAVKNFVGDGACMVKVTMSMVRDADEFSVRPALERKEKEIEETKKKQKNGNQYVGTFGEKAVEAELWRRGWQAANLNLSINNAAGYDILARRYDENLKRKKELNIRVKTCVLGKNVIFPERFIDLEYDQLTEGDLTIIVRMARNDRSKDTFFIIPTWIVLRDIKWWRWLDDIKTPQNPLGRDKKNTHMWALKWEPRSKTNDDEPSMFKADWEENWDAYRERWESLDHTPFKISDWAKPEHQQFTQRPPKSFKQAWAQYCKNLPK